MKSLTRVLLLLISVILFSCTEDNNQSQSVEYVVKGVIQKGPFVSGSSVTIQELNEQLIQTGNSFNFETINDFGEFEFLAELSNNYVEIQTTGFYFNEVSGELVNANLTLRAIADLQTSSNLNVNILTTLSKGRIKVLLENGASFEDAKNQAESEILQAFFIDQEAGDFINMDISQAGEKNAILLAISVIMQGDREVASFSELLSKIALDLETDGELQQENVDIIQASAAALSPDLNKIRTNLEQRYQSLGLTGIEIPQFESYTVQISDQPLKATTIPANGEDVAISDSVIVNFNSPVQQSGGSAISDADLNSFFLMNENGSPISFQGYINDQKTQVVIKSDSPLKSGTTYNLSLVKPIENIAGEILSDLSVTFQSGYICHAQEIENTFLDEPIAKQSVMHYQQATKRLLIFDFLNNQIISYDPVNNTHTSSAFPALDLPNIGAEDIAPYSNPTYFVDDRLYIRDFYFDLNESKWTDIRDPDDLSVEPWYGSIPLNEYQFISKTLVYGYRKDYDQQDVVSLGFYSYNIETKDLQLLTTVDQIGTESIESYDLNQNEPIYSEESNKILFSIAAVGDNDTFYLELNLSDNSVAIVDKSSVFSGVTSTRYSAAFASHTTNNEVIIYGGRKLGVQGYHNDIWAYRFDNEEWINYQNSSSLELNAGNDFVYAFVPELNSMYVYGGYGSLFLDERLIQIEFR